MSEKSSKGSTSTVSPPKRVASGDFDNDEPPKKKLSFSTKIQMKPKDKKLQPSTKMVAKNSFSISIKPKAVEQKQKKIIPKAAAAFDDDSDSDPEEMPLEARMRMRNIGRNTPTSAGPNSFNKSKLGFTDSQKSWQKQQQSLLDKINKPDVKK